MVYVSVSIGLRISLQHHREHVQKLLQRHGDIAVAGIAAVVGHHDEPFGACAELVLQDQKILAAEANDAGDLSSQAMAFFAISGRRSRNTSSSTKPCSQG